MSVYLGRPLARAAALLAGTVLAGVALTAAPAAADPAGLEVVSTPTGLTSVDKAHGAFCPPGKVVSGGGGFLASSSTAQGRVALDRLEPVADGSGFIAGMREAGPTNFPDPWQLNTVAICVTKPAGYEIKSAPGLPEQDYVDVSCGTKSVIGMGGRVNNGGAGDIVLDQVNVSADLKTVTARGVDVQGGSTSGWTVTAFAICASIPAANLALVKVPSATNSTATRLAVGVCPPGTALFSLGADIQGGNGQILLTGLNIAPTDTSRVWAAEDADGWNPSWTITAYGICG